MRCRHRPVAEKSKVLRSLWLEEDERSENQCRRIGRESVRGKWLCSQHAELWRTHYRILDRILAMPVRRSTL